jgi:hypothetical protein
MNTHQADPAARRTAVILVVVIAVIGGLLIFAAGAARPHVQAWVEEDLRSRLTIVIAALTFVASGPPLALAVYLWRFGTRVIDTARFPPPEARVMSDTPILTGESARARGRMLRIFSALVAAGAILIAASLLRFALMLW